MPRSRSRTRTALFVLAATVLSVGAAGLAGEAVVRTFSLIDHVSIHPRRLYATTQDPRRPYRLRPGERDLLVHDTQVRISRLGLRGAEEAGDDAHTLPRILALGDSIVFGWGLEEAETFAVQLEQELRRRGRPVRVFNAGTPGYNTLSEVAVLEELEPRLEPDLVVLGVSLNDFAETPRLNARGYLTTSAPDQDCWLERYSELYLLWRWLGGAGTIGAFAARWNDEAQAQLVSFLEKRAASARNRFYREPGGEGLERILSSLSTLRNYTADREIDLVLLVFPELDQVDSNSEAPIPQERWRSWCHDLGLSCLDLQPAFLESGRGAELFADLQHPSALGVGVSVRATADWLEEQGLTTPGPSPPGGAGRTGTSALEP